MGNLANLYGVLGRLDEGLRLRQDVYSATLKLCGEEHEDTLLEANNYANALCRLERYAEAKALFQKTTPVARRVLGESHELTLMMRWNYARVFYENPDAALNDLREAVTMVEDTERIARRVFGGAHPLTEGAAGELQKARAALHARETPPPGSGKKI